MKAEEALAVAKTYVNQTLVGMGALKGAPCTIKSMTKSGRLTTTVFEWTDTNNVKHENTMLVYDGEDGDDGFSPTITVKSSTSSEYILTITDKNGSYDTPNLKGSGGGGGASALTDLTDVELSSLASGDALVFNGSKWANVSLATVATSGSYNDLTDKPTIPAAQVNSDWDAVSGVAQILNKPTIPAAQVQSDWNQSDSSEVDYIKNKPVIPAAQVNADWDAASGVAQILNKPTIPAAQVQSDWNQTDSSEADYIKNKPTIPTAQQSDWAQTDSSAIDFIKNKPTLATVATSGDYDDLTNKPIIPAAQQSDWAQTDSTQVDFIKNKPTLATVATSGDYDDLTNKPTIPAAQVNADWDAASGVAQILNKPTLATVATSGDYDDLTNKPTIPAAQVQSDWGQTDNTQVDFIKNKPTIPAAQVNSDWDAASGVAQILNKPTLATVATSGSYNDLTNKPTIPAAQVNSDWNAASGLAQILNKPTIPDAVTIDSTGTASATGTRYQRVGIGAVYTEIDGTKYMEQTKTLSTSSSTTFTFTNAAITADSLIQPYASIFGIVPSNITASAGSCVVTIPSYSSAVSCKVRIYIR